MLGRIVIKPKRIQRFIGRTMLVFALLCLLPLSYTAAAETPQRHSAFQLKGLSKKEILSRFGKPDQKVEKSPGRETWMFGSSMIFFTQEKVLAWTDSGELVERGNLSNVRAVGSKNVSRSSDRWENPWTPKAEEDIRDEVLRDVIGPEES